MTTDPASPVELLHGVSLAEYAGISTALAEGISLEPVLQQEGIPHEAWAEASPAWKVRVARSGEAGDELRQLREKTAIAEDCLARSVAPIDTELPAWMSFLRAYAAHAQPFELLRGIGLGLNDLARLQRRWAARLAKEPELAKRASELAKQDLPPTPRLTVAPVALKPFPWTPKKESARSSPTKAKRAAMAPPAETSLAPGQLRLYSYVALKARMLERPDEADRILREVGMKDFASVDAEWTAILADNPELERDYRRLLEGQRAKIRVGPRTAPSPLPPEPSRPIVPVSAPSHLKGTALALDVPHGPALPFAPGPAQLPPPKPVSVVDAKNRPPLAGTSLVLDVPRGPALPFARASEEAKPAAPIAANPAPRPKSELAGTALAVGGPLRAALPFSPGGPRLTLEQHALLVCEMEQDPAHAEATLGRYGVTLDQRRELDVDLERRMATDESLRVRWEEAKRISRERLASSPSVTR